jgi:hypothetical protein
VASGRLRVAESEATPVVPALFLIVTAYLLVNTLVGMPARALAGLGLIAAGLPVCGYFKRHARDDTDTCLWRDED